MEDLAIPLLVKLAGGMAMVTGAFTIGLAIQTSLIFRMSGRIPAIIAAMVVLGIAAVVTGWGTVQGRGASAIAATAMSGLVAVLGTAVLVGIAIAPARKVWAARERLRAQGYDFRALI
jgi:hypothetical protein